MINNVKYDIGEKLMIEMMRSKDGRRPIGKIDKGMVCLIDHKDKNTLQFGAVWQCEIIEVKEKCLIVKPLTLITSADQNETEAFMMAKRAFAKPKQEHPRKSKANYQFKRAGER
jgi:hypothetical protein